MIGNVNSKRFSRKKKKSMMMYAMNATWIKYFMGAVFVFLLFDLVFTKIKRYWFWGGYWQVLKFLFGLDIFSRIGQRQM